MKPLALATFVLLAASIGMLLAPAAVAQTPGTTGTAPTSKSAPKPGQLNGSDLDEAVNSDVANKYYSAQQGEELKAQYDAAMERVEASLDKVTSSFAKYASLAASSADYQKMNSDIYSFVDGNTNLQLGRGTPQEIAQQAESIYEMADQGAQILATLQESVTPVVNEALGELDQVVAARAALINANPAVSADVKHNATYQSNSFSDYVHNDADRILSTAAATMRADQDRMESNKTVIVQTLTKLLPLVASNTDKYGPDPTKWPAPPKGYFDTNHNGTDSNGTVGNSNGAAGNGTGTGYASQLPDSEFDDEMVVRMQINAETGVVVVTAPPPRDPNDAHLPQTTIYIPGNGPIPGYNQLVDTSQTTGTLGNTAAGTQAPSLATYAGQSLGPYSDGSDLNGASFTSIYSGYTVVPGQNGSAVISVPSTQVQMPSSVMTAPTDQVETGTNQVLVPSTQVNTPSPVINMLGTQVPMPSLCGR